MGGGTFQCSNHPDRVAVGICNDCGKNFCRKCLHVYALETRSAKVILYLCPTCLRKRHIESANVTIYTGVIFLLLGIFSAVISLPLGILVIIVGLGFIVYGNFKRAEVPEETTIDDLQVEKDKREAQLAATEGVDIEEIYSRLLTQYANHWGAQTGNRVLESEIMAHIRYGISFPEAIRKIYQRQKKKTS